MRHILILGCGDVGRHVAALWLKQDIAVYGVARQQESCQAMQAIGVQPIVADLDDPSSLKALPIKDALVYSFTPPPADGVIDQRLRYLLDAISLDSLPARIVAISTTGVYGDQGGALINEDMPPNPQTDRGRRRLDGENTLRLWGREHQVPVVILRVGGIYGPGRLPMTRIRNQVPIIEPALSPRTNRIHVEDLAQVCVAAATRGHVDTVYNISDGQDSNMTEYFFTLADAFGLPRPPTVDWQTAEQVMTKGMLSYLKESRRIDNRRMLKDLDIHLQFPDLQHWLRSIDLEQELKCY